MPKRNLTCENDDKINSARRLLQHCQLLNKIFRGIFGNFRGISSFLFFPMISRGTHNDVLQTVVGKQWSTADPFNLSCGLFNFAKTWSAYVGHEIRTHRMKNYMHNITYICVWTPRAIQMYY